MTKCNVISYNPYREVMVFDYNGMHIQSHYHFDSVPEFIFVSEKDNGTFEFSLKDVQVKKTVTKNKVETKLVQEEVKESEKKDS